MNTFQDIFLVCVLFIFRTFTNKTKQRFSGAVDSYHTLIVWNIWLLPIMAHDFWLLFDQNWSFRRLKDFSDSEISNHVKKDFYFIYQQQPRNYNFACLNIKVFTVYRELLARFLSQISILVQLIGLFVQIYLFLKIFLLRRIQGVHLYLKTSWHRFVSAQFHIIHLYTLFLTY